MLGGSLMAGSSDLAVSRRRLVSFRLHVSVGGRLRVSVVVCVSVGGGVNAGVPIGDNNRPLQVYDVVATYTASDDLDLWLNIDYGF